VRGTAAHVNDVTEGNSLLHGPETQGFGDAGYQGVDKRADAKAGVTWHVAMRPGKRKLLDLSNPLLSNPLDELINQIEKAKASIRAKVEQVQA
jgi:transposase, IS5 family